MSINLNYSEAQFTLLKHKDDNFAENILQYLYLSAENEPLQTYIVIYNYLIHLSSNLFKS